MRGLFVSHKPNANAHTDAGADARAGTRSRARYCEPQRAGD